MFSALVPVSILFVIDKLYDIFFCAMNFLRWADTNAVLPIPKSPRVQIGGGRGCLLICIESLILSLFPFPSYACARRQVADYILFRS